MTEPVTVRVHDFIDKDLGEVVPYGAYDLACNEGWSTSASIVTRQSSPGRARAASRPRSGHLFVVFHRRGDQVRIWF
jgi:hypothetical protein